MRSARAIAVFFSIALAGSAALAQRAEIPLTNWTVPPYRAAESSPGLRPLVDISPGVGFVAMTPCRIVDTRGGGVFTGAYGPPALVANTPRDFDLNSAPHCTGIPSGVEAYSLNFTVTDTTAQGDLRAWPQGSPPVLITSVVNWTAPGTIIANATIIPSGASGGITVTSAGSAANVLIDINGYFTDEYENSNNLVVHVSSTSPAIAIDNASTSCNGGIYSGCGIEIDVAGGNALLAAANEESGMNYGVMAFTLSPDNGSAGVRGEPASEICGTPDSPVGVLGLGGAEVEGEVPVLGMGDFAGVVGINTDGCAAAVATFGALGYTDRTAVFASGDMTATGVKPVVDPHPTDPGKVIKYVALEGPEAGTYFRGRGRFQRGIATIDVPEDFRMVTDAEGLTIQVTPIGQMATVAVESIGLDRIVVRGSRNVEFFYTVNGVRRSFKDWNPIQENREFAAHSENATMVGAWSAEQKRLLVQNGSYEADGTVNRETARRLGWDKKWPGNRPQVRPQRKRVRERDPR